MTINTQRLLCMSLLVRPDFCCLTWTPARSPLWHPLLEGGTVFCWWTCGRQPRCWRTSPPRGCQGHYRCLLWRQTHPYQYRRTTEHRAGLTLTNTPQSEDVPTESSQPVPVPVPSRHPVPVMLSCPWTSRELLLQHSLSSVNSSLPSMLIVCCIPVMPEVWNGPGERKTTANISGPFWREKKSDASQVTPGRTVNTRPT